MLVCLVLVLTALCRINATVIGSKNAPESAADEGGAADHAEEAEEKADQAEEKTVEEVEEKAEEAEA